MPTRTDLKKLAFLKLQEAEALYDVGLYHGAAYLCGYVIELALKARICRLLDVPEYPATGKLRPVYAVHDLNQLLLLAGLKRKLDLSSKPLFEYWSTAVPWTPDRRYEPIGSISRKDAQEILTAIRDRKDGIFRWLKKYW